MLLSSVQWRRHAPFLLLVLVLGAVGFWVLPRDGAPGVEAPSVVGAAGDRTLRIAESGPLRLAFPVAMDEQTVEQYLTVDPPVEGMRSWENGELLVRPSAPLTLGQQITVTVGAQALRRDGVPIGRDLVYRFIVAGPPAVAFQQPRAGATDVDPAQPVRMVFDRPMVPLTTLQERGALDVPALLQPPTGGTWRWLSTTTLEFQPEGGLLPATEYAVTIDADMTDIAGTPVGPSLGFGFSTRRASVVSSDPPNGFDRAGPRTEVVLRFNQPVDLSSVERSTRFVRATRKLDDQQMAQIREESVSPDIARPVTFRAVYGRTGANGRGPEDRSVVVLIPQVPLDLETWHAVVVDDGVRSLRGSLGSEHPYLLQFRTAGAMELASHRFEYGTLTLTFTNPVAGPTVKKGLTIVPKPDGWDDLSFQDASWEQTELWITLPWKPSTTYTVSVDADLQDVFGQGAAAASKTFTTPALDPRVFIHSAGSFGVFERGKPPVFYLNAVNVSRMDIAVAKLDLPSFLDMQRSMQTDWSYAPDLAGRSDARTWQLPHHAEKNAWAVTPFDVAERMGGTLDPGIYGMTLSAPEYRNPWDGSIMTEKIFFTITNIALTLKYSGHHALVWAVDTQTGAPVADAAIAFHDLNGTTVLRGRTDAQGFFETALSLKDLGVAGNTWNPEFWVTAQKDGDFAMVGSTWDSGMRPRDFDLHDGFTGGGGSRYLESFLYTDRPLYRAGDTVGIKGVVRLRNPVGALEVPRNERAHLRIEDPEGQVVLSKTIPLSDMGSFQTALPLDSTAKLGTYWMMVELDPGDDVVNNGGSASFQVLAYRKPEYSVEVTFDGGEAYDGQTVQAVVDGQYYFGAPMADAKVTWRAITTDYFFNRFTDGWYAFSLEDAWCWWECERETKVVAEGSGVLDANGKAVVRIPMDLSAEPLSQILSIDAEVTDRTNQVVAARGSIPVHKAGIYVGIRADTYGVAPGENAQFSLITVHPDGTPAPGTSVQLQLFSRQWTTVRTRNVDGQYYYENTPHDTLVETTSVVTGADGKTTAHMVIPRGGGFRVLATVRDSAGRIAQADTSVYAWSSTYINWPRTNSNRMTVIADKPEYAPGDTAHILIQSPFQGPGVTALVTVEREQVLQWTLVPVESSAQSIEIPVTDVMMPNAYVSVIVLKPRMGETFNEHGLDTGAPAFRIGYVRLKVDASSKQLTVDIEPQKRRFSPGETVDVLLRTSDARGNPVEAEVSLAAVDMSVLALTGFRVPDLLGIFYSNRPLGVRTAQSLLYLLERFKPGSKGGGGADGEDRTRGVFKDTAYWNPSIRTDSRGEARVSFRLPDNLTTWQLLAVGHTRGSLVGAFATEILETKRVIVRPVRPRFAVMRDRAELGAVIRNGLPERRTFRVTLSGKGFTSDATLEQQVTVDPDAQVHVTFPVTFGEHVQAELTFLAETEGARDEIRETIPLMPFGTPQAVAVAGVTDTTAAEQVFLPLSQEISGAKLTATLAPTLATYLPKSLEYLVRFPYGCAEQTVSSFLPNIAVAALQGFDAFTVVSREELDEKVAKGIQRLSGFQRSDGGFGYWEGSAESYPYLTAYVLHALWQARQAGYTVDSGVLERARAYLSGVLRSPTVEVQANLAQRAYILFVFAETGSPDVSQLNNLHAQREQLPLFAKAYLAMAFERAGNHRRALDLLGDILGKAKISPRGAVFAEEDPWKYRSLMHTDARSTAIVAQAVTRIDPDHVLLPDIIRGMLASRRAGHWDTTQSTTMSIFALVEYLRRTGELDAAFTATLGVDGTEVGRAAFTAANILTRQSMVIPASALDDGAFNTVQVAKDGTGRLYYDLLLEYALRSDTIVPAEEGMSITREVAPIMGSPAQPTVGGTYKVTLTMTVPADRHFVAVESPHPAGFEGIDFALQTTQKRLQEELDHSDEWSWENPLWYFTHREFRDDQVFLFAEYLPAGVYRYEYLVRATLPGRFRQRPARMYEMYFPELFGQTDGGWMTIRPGS